jgi:hypothetical protein
MNFKYSAKQNFRKYKTYQEPNISQKRKIKEDQILIQKITEAFGIKPENTNYTNVSTFSIANPIKEELIQQITITCNGVQLCNINDYNLLYNTLYDLEGADFSQTSKRFLENADPSVYYYQGDTIAAGNSVYYVLMLLEMHCC